MISINTYFVKRRIISSISLLSSVLAFCQTTVTLQDQCNCEVLKGTDVSVSGSTAPAGADVGDIYVNTNTGTIYFWDGDSWELTALDNQQLQGFGLDEATNVLTLTLENGGSIAVDLSSLSDTLTDTTIVSYGIDATNTNLVIVDSDSNTFSVALADMAALVNTDGQNLGSSVVSANESVEIQITGGTGTTIDIRDADSDPSNEDQTVSPGPGISVLRTDEDFQVSNTAPDLTVTLSDGGGGNVTIGGTYPNFTLDVPDDTDDQNAGEVDLVTPVDMDGAGETSPTNETTVEAVIQAIAPITSKAARIFYPPSILVDASTIGMQNIDLYQEYLNQFGTPTVGSMGAPLAIPTYGRNELYYYVTYADPMVFETDSGDPNFMSIDADGNLAIEVENVPTDYNTLINVVFVVK